jgi:hypothetical protein
LLLLITSAFEPCGAEPVVQIRSPKDGTRFTQEHDYVLVGGKAAANNATSPNVDIFLVLDVSGSTAQPAGEDFADFFQLPNLYVHTRTLGGLGLPCAGPGRPGPLNLRNSILAVEIMASRRLLSQLNPESTRVGVITFGDDASLRQPLTHNFEQVRSTLDLVYRRGPYGGTNMVNAIRLATEELLGKGDSEKYLESSKALLLFTDGFPTRPTADCSSADSDLAISAAQQAGKSGINVHVFALGEEAVSNPRAAIGIAEESGGTYKPVSTPADLLAVIDTVPVVKLELIHVTNETIGKGALLSRLAPDGFFASAVPLKEGSNRIEVLARASDGSIGKDTITVHYEPRTERSLDLEIFLEDERRLLDLKVFLEREKSLKLEIERLGKNPSQMQRDVERNREEGLR